MIDHLTFECPHCGQPVQVKEDVLGGTVDCPHCDRAFQATAPAGRLIAETGTATASVDAPADQEQVLREVHPVLFRHHLLLSAVCLLLLIAAVVGLVMFLSSSSLFGMTGGWLLAASLLAGVVALVFVGKCWLNVLGTTLTITSSRTILRKGILSKNTSEVQHDDVRNIKSDRNTLERLLNYGDIAISSSGQDDFEIVANDIPDPDGILEIIRRHQVKRS